MRTELAKSRGSEGEHRARYVSVGTDHHPGHPCGNPPDQYRIPIGCQEVGDSLHHRVPRGDSQLCRLYDILSGMFVTYIGGRYNLI